MVEQLFESRTIEQIRELEREKRRQIEEKKEEMKETVGARYRDIIESADSITEMRDCCRAMVKAGDAMQLHCDAVNSATRRIQEFAALAVQSTTNTSSVVAMGHSVNFLLDTPSHIWTCMDEHRQLDATLRFLSSQRVHTELTRSHADHATLVRATPHPPPWPPAPRLFPTSCCVASRVGRGRALRIVHAAHAAGRRCHGLLATGRRMCSTFAQSLPAAAVLACGESASMRRSTPTFWCR